MRNIVVIRMMACIAKLFAEALQTAPTEFTREMCLPQRHLRSLIHESSSG